MTNHNCIECKSEYLFEIDINNYKNCYKNCSYYYYFDKNNNKYYCSKSLECPENYNKLILDKRECINKCEEDDIYKFEYNNICYKESKESKILFKKVVF